MSLRVLCVDDDPNVLAGYERSLRKSFSLHTVTGAEEGLLALTECGPFAVVVADMQMPRMNGVQFLARARQMAPDAVRVMLTGNADQKTAADAVNAGHIFRFLTKPCPAETFAATLQAGLEQHRLIVAERELLEKTLNGSIKVLTDILATVEPQVFGRSQKVREYMSLVATALQEPERWAWETAGMLSRIGCVTIPPTVAVRARNDEMLAGPEKDMFERLPEIGARLLANVPRLESVARIVLYQNKKFDGSGFPIDAVAGEEIPAGARVLRILEDLLVLEAKGFSRFKALHQLKERSGWYDPRMLEVIFDCFQVGVGDGAGASVRSRSVTLQELKIGDVLLAHVETIDGMKIVALGTTVSQVVLEKMQNFASISGLKEPLVIEAAP